jgi:hypothetical protein
MKKTNDLKKESATKQAFVCAPSSYRESDFSLRDSARSAHSTNIALTACCFFALPASTIELSGSDGSLGAPQ